jgi:hypothetical protein
MPVNTFFIGAEFKSARVMASSPDEEMEKGATAFRNSFLHPLTPAPSEAAGESAF